MLWSHLSFSEVNVLLDCPLDFISRPFSPNSGKGFFDQLHSDVYLNWCEARYILYSSLQLYCWILWIFLMPLDWNNSSDKHIKKACSLHTRQLQYLACFCMDCIPSDWLCSNELSTLYHLSCPLPITEWPSQVNRTVSHATSLLILMLEVISSRISQNVYFLTILRKVISKGICQRQTNLIYVTGSGIATNCSKSLLFTCFQSCYL